MSAAEKSYEELASCKVAGVPVGKYRSLRTGLVVCIAQVEGPLVHGYFCLGKRERDTERFYSICPCSH